jgi:hypothetical protein
MQKIENAIGSIAQKAKEKAEEITKSRLQNNFGKWDQAFSRYRHEIQCVGYQVPMVGYSKGQNMKAPKDPVIELTKCIARIFKRYHHKIEVITFYVNDDNRTPIVSLYPDKYVLSPEFFDDKPLDDFMQKLYIAHKNGWKEEDVSFLHPRENKAMVKLDPFSLAFTIKSITRLVQYCRKLADGEGYPRGEVEAFYYKYLEKHKKKMTQ